MSKDFSAPLKLNVVRWHVGGISFAAEPKLRLKERFERCRAGFELVEDKHFSSAAVFLVALLDLGERHIELKVKDEIFRRGY